MRQGARLSCSALMMRGTSSGVFWATLTTTAPILTRSVTRVTGSPSFSSRDQSPVMERMGSEKA